MVTNTIRNTKHGLIMQKVCEYNKVHYIHNKLESFINVRCDEIFEGQKLMMSQMQRLGYSEDRITQDRNFISNMSFYNLYICSNVNAI